MAEDLSDEQRAVLAFDRTVRFHRVQAAAGSGKTRTLVALAARLCHEHGVRADEMFVATFTVNAAEELARRLRAAGVEAPYVGTFHSLAQRITRAPVDLLTTRTESLEALHACVTEGRAPRFRAIVCDEHQDADGVQHAIVDALAFPPPGHPQPHVFVFGDAAQSVYEWRDARPERFRTFLPGHAAHTLSTNFRSTPEVVAFANPSAAVPMVPHRPTAGVPVRAMWFPNERAEARFVAAQVLVDVQERGHAPHQVGVLARTNRPLDGVREALLRAGVRVSRGVRKGCVGVTTAHGAKGLEWGIVYVVDARDVRWPADKTRWEEDERVFHVAATRARTRLVWTYAADPATPTRFLARAARAADDAGHGVAWRPPTLADAGFVESDDSRVRADLSATARLTPDRACARLDESAVATLRAEGLFPQARRRHAAPTETLHDAWDLPAYVLEHEVEAEYGAFVALVVARELGVRELPGVATALAATIPGVHDEADAVRRRQRFGAEATDAATAACKADPRSAAARAAARVPREHADAAEAAYVRFRDHPRVSFADLWMLALCARLADGDGRRSAFFGAGFEGNDEETLALDRARRALRARALDQLVDPAAPAARLVGRAEAGEAGWGLARPALLVGDRLLAIRAHEGWDAFGDVLRNMLVAAVLREAGETVRGLWLYHACEGTLDAVDLEEGGRALLDRVRAMLTATET